MHDSTDDTYKIYLLEGIYRGRHRESQFVVSISAGDAVSDFVGDKITDGVSDMPDGIREEASIPELHVIFWDKFSDSRGDVCAFGMR